MENNNSNNSWTIRLIDLFLFFSFFSFLKVPLCTKLITSLSVKKRKYLDNTYTLNNSVAKLILISQVSTGSKYT